MEHCFKYRALELEVNCNLYEYLEFASASNITGILAVILKISAMLLSGYSIAFESRCVIRDANCGHPFVFQPF